MHFMDVMNFDVERIQRCDIHYATPDGRVIPFCTYNNFHRERIEQSFRVDPKVWTKIASVSPIGWRGPPCRGPCNLPQRLSPFKPVLGNFE